MCKKVDVNVNPVLLVPVTVDTMSGMVIAYGAKPLVDSGKAFDEMGMAEEFRSLVQREAEVGELSSAWMTVPAVNKYFYSIEPKQDPIDSEISDAVSPAPLFFFKKLIAHCFCNKTELLKGDREPETQRPETIPVSTSPIPAVPSHPLL